MSRMFVMKQDYSGVFYTRLRENFLKLIFMGEDRLGAYNKEPNFQVTLETDNLRIQFDWAGGEPIFVIQKHAAFNTPL